MSLSVAIYGKFWQSGVTGNTSFAEVDCGVTPTLTAMDTGSDLPQVDVRPVDVDGVGAVAIGTALWAIALVVCLIFRARLVEAGSDWWIWVCVSGFVLGLAGLPYVIRRRSAYRAASSSD